MRTEGRPGVSPESERTDRELAAREFIYSGSVRDIDTESIRVEFVGAADLSKNEINAKLKQLYKKKTGAIYDERLRVAQNEPKPLPEASNATEDPEQLNLFN